MIRPHDEHDHDVAFVVVVIVDDDGDVDAIIGVLLFFMVDLKIINIVTYLLYFHSRGTAYHYSVLISVDFAIFHYLCYHQASNISRTNSQNLNVSCLVLQLFWPIHGNHAGVKPRMKTVVGAVPTKVPFISEVWQYLHFADLICRHQASMS